MAKKRIRPAAEGKATMSTEDRMQYYRSAMERQEKWPKDWTDTEAWTARLEEVHKKQWKNEDGTSKHPTRSAEHFKTKVHPHSVHWAGPSRRVSVATLAKRGFEYGFRIWAGGVTHGQESS